MTEQLTKEQEIIVEQNKKEWLNKFFGYDSTTFSKERCTKAIKSLYTMCGLIEPDVIIVDSPHAAQITANKLESLLFKNKVQNLNVRRSQLIVDTLEKRYKEVFDKSYVPKSKRGDATSDKKVDVVQKQFLKDQLKKLVG